MHVCTSYKKCCNTIELMFQKELTSIKQVLQKSVIFVIVSILKMLVLNMNHVCNGCHDISIMAYELKNISILNVKGVDYRCILWGIIKNEAVNILNNSVLKHRGAL